MPLFQHRDRDDQQQRQHKQRNQQHLRPLPPSAALKLLIVLKVWKCGKPCSKPLLECSCMHGVLVCMDHVANEVRIKEQQTMARCHDNSSSFIHQTFRQ